MRGTHDAPAPLDAFGYAIAVAISLLILAVEIGASAAFDGSGAAGAVEVSMLVMSVGLVPAALIGTVGSLIVHLVTGRRRSQWWSVALAAALGFPVGFIFFQSVFPGGIALALATAIGRAAVVPHVARVREHGAVPGLV